MVVFGGKISVNFSEENWPINFKLSPRLHRILHPKEKICHLESTLGAVARKENTPFRTKSPRIFLGLDDALGAKFKPEKAIERILPNWSVFMTLVVSVQS